MADYLALAAMSLVLVYTFWQLNNFRKWQETGKLVEDRTGGPWPFLTLIIPFRNEREHLPDLLKDLRAQDYPTDRWEAIFIDDFSTDGGASFLEERTDEHIHLLHLVDAPDALTTIAHKKSAITLAISRSRGQVMVTTDADCRWPSDGLTRIAGEFRSGKEVVLGPVLIDPVRDICEGYQALDLMAYQFLTRASMRGGAPILANGAHFAFRKELFLRVGGYAGVDHLPSGDDVLLLHKFALERPRYGYVPGTPVMTRPVRGWRNLWRQRLRWAGKAGNYTEPRLKWAQALSYLTSLSLVVGTLGTLWHPRSLAIVLIAWILKALVDGFCLDHIARHYGQRDRMRWYPTTALIYPIFLVAVGTAALLGLRADWKGRKADGLPGN
ncbi:glycosyltransferase [Lewinella sp. W8]|uniref:glycosyltransferase n=1 Tax=Lewinella sp. W8 TaxID=2528208 RepID=UPI001067E38F|nr:glycosyltransferase [Lewinella sp. W8]MTB51782.1 glycosyltransferase [Lewinella sp. W8]